MGSKKGGSDTEAPPQATEMNTSGMEEAVGGFMESMAVMMASQQNQSQLALEQQMMEAESAGTADTADVDEVDWTEKNAELEAKIRGDYDVEQARKMNSVSTVLTSPLMDDEEPSTTKSILGSG